MAVTLNAAGSFQLGLSGLSTDYNGLTIASGSTTTLLVVVTLNNNHAGLNASPIWDNGGTNQVMDNVSFSQFNSLAGCVQMWALLNPTLGHKTLHTTTSAAFVTAIAAVAFNGVRSSAGFTTGTGGALDPVSALASAGVSSFNPSLAGCTVGNGSICVVGTEATLTALSNTNVYLDTTFANNNSALSYNLSVGSTTETYNATGSSVANWESITAQIFASTASSGTAFQWYPMDADMETQLPIWTQDWVETTR